MNHCLVVVDHFTKCLEWYPLRNQKSETIARKVFDCWVPQHGASEQIHHQEICSFFEIRNTQTPPFHLQSDGASEWSIRIVNSMLEKIVKKDQRNWDLYILPTCLAYNIFLQSSSGFTSSFLRFGHRTPFAWWYLLQSDSFLSPYELHSNYATVPCPNQGWHRLSSFSSREMCRIVIRKLTISDGREPTLIK